MQGNDDFLSGKVEAYKQQKVYDRELTPKEMIDAQLNSNFRVMEQIRARVDSVVKSPKTAAALKPYYPYGCKRPTFHDEFLPTFNLPHVHLVDTAPTGVKLIDERGSRSRRRGISPRCPDLRDRVSNGWAPAPST